MREEILKNVKTSFIGKNIVYKSITDSTNNLAKQNLDLPSGTVFVADIQTNGRGRSGKSWISDNKDGLWMSILLKPDISPERLSCLTLVAGFAVLKALQYFVDAEVYIKWPNDIVIENKKVCGILCELINQDNIGTNVVCGIGINVSTDTFPDEISDIATSVKNACQNKLTREEIASEVINQFEPLYVEYIKNGFDNLVCEYKNYCITLNKNIKLVLGNEHSEGFAFDVNSSGELVVRCGDKTLNVSCGEVSVRGLYGYV